MDRKSAYHVDIDRQLRQALPTSSTIKKPYIHIVQQLNVQHTGLQTRFHWLNPDRKKNNEAKQNYQKNDGKTGFNRIFAQTMCIVYSSQSFPNKLKYSIPTQFKFLALLSALCVHCTDRFYAAGKMSTQFCILWIIRMGPVVCMRLV